MSDINWQIAYWVAFVVLTSITLSPFVRWFVESRQLKHSIKGREQCMATRPEIELLEDDFLNLSPEELRAAAHYSKEKRKRDALLREWNKDRPDCAELARQRKANRVT